jgi:hypothetical protein
MSDKFTRQLHPALRERVGYVLEDLRARGWNPIVPEIFGKYGTGFRSQADQAKLRKTNPGRTRVKFSFHNVTAADGKPQSMAVHITDPSVGSNPKRGHPFVEDLQAISERHGLRTGNKWKKPWDPLHVQLFDNSALRAVRAGRRPHLPDPRLTLMPPRLLIHEPAMLPPRSAADFNLGERFKLTSKLTTPFAVPANARLAWPTISAPISRREFEAGRRLELSARYLGQSINERRGCGFRPAASAPFASPSMRQPTLGDFRLRRPDVSSSRPTIGESLRLTRPSFELPSPSAPSLGNFKLRPPSL